LLLLFNPLVNLKGLSVLPQTSSARERNVRIQAPTVADFSLMFASWATKVEFARV